MNAYILKSFETVARIIVTGLVTSAGGRMRALERGEQVEG